jgi:hypothetical protein
MIAGSGSGRGNHDGEAERIANVVDTFARAIATTKRRESAVVPLQILGSANYDETEDCDFECSDDYDYEEAEDCDSD